MTPPPALSVAESLRPAPQPADSRSTATCCACWKVPRRGYFLLLGSALLVVTGGRAHLDLPDLHRPRHRRLHAPGLLGRVHHDLRVLGRHRARRHADLGDPLPVPRQVAQRHQPQRRGDDGVRGDDGRACSRHPHRPRLEGLLHAALPEPARALAELQVAARCGTSSRSRPTRPPRSCSSTSG